MKDLEQYFADQQWRKQNETHYSLILPNGNKVDVLLDKERDIAKREFYFSDNLNRLVMDSPFLNSETILNSLKDLMSGFKNYKRHRTN